MTRLPSVRALRFALVLLLAVVFAPAASAFAQDDAAGSLNPLASLDKSKLKDFVEQPLFEPSRHPPVIAPPVAYVAPPPAPPPPEPPPSLKLLGLVEGARSLAAVVHLNDSGKTETLHPGDHLGIWIVGVSPGGLRVTSGDRAFDYALFHGGAQQGPVPVAPPAAFLPPTAAARDAAPSGSR